MNKEFFKNNRAKLLDKMEDNTAVILFAGSAPKKSGDENYPFIPNRNFYYMTGDNEEKDILILTKTKNGHTEEMFIRKIDPVKVKWVGPTYTEEKIKELSDIDRVSFLDDFNLAVFEIFNYMGIHKIYLDLERIEEDEMDTLPYIYARELKEKYPNAVIKDVYPLIAELRMVKEDCEVEELKKAIHITRLGLDSVMKEIKNTKNEKHLANTFAYTIFENGANEFAFDTIVASHKNSTTLHYHANNTDIVEGSVVLFDLGAEHNYYKADISRTYPSNGKFSDKQKEIYNIVLDVQKEVFKKAKPGVTIRELDNFVIDYYAKELKKLGYIKEDKEVRRYYFHSISHHLGLDTHDATIYNKKLEKGNVITVEPGLYFEEFNIGVRIEDDILITEDGNEVLSKEIIKEIKDVEDFINK